MFYVNDLLKKKTITTNNNDDDNDNNDNNDNNNNNRSWTHENDEMCGSNGKRFEAPDWHREQHHGTSSEIFGSPNHHLVGWFPASKNFIQWDCPS